MNAALRLCIHPERPRACAPRITRAPEGGEMVTVVNVGRRAGKKTSRV